MRAICFKYLFVSVAIASAGSAAAMQPSPGLTLVDNRSSATVSVYEIAMTDQISGTGTLQQGVSCMQVTLDDGQTYSIQDAPPLLKKLNVGQRVTVKGTLLAGSTCMQGEAVSLSELDTE